MSGPVQLSRYHAVDIFDFALTRIDAGERVVLIIITAIAGSSARPIGTPMVVAETGDYAGYLSNGCVDGDIALQALSALEDGKARTVIYGAGSPYLDIRLPCGGGLTTRVIPNPDAQVLRAVSDDLHARKTAELSLGGASQGYAPPLKILAAGRGEDLLFFANAAHAIGVDISVFTPDDLRAFVGAQIDAKSLSDHANFASDADEQTAVILLFHDHDYEAPILIDALSTPAFYIGAMGSRATHAARLEGLSKSNVSADNLARLRGPVGLVPSMRDAGRLAVSILAEIIDAERRI